jgi:D-alanine transfer protein
MLDPTIPEDMKLYISQRVEELTDEYNSITHSSVNEYNSAGMMSADAGKTDLWAVVKETALKPYYLFSNWLLNLKDKAASAKVIRENDRSPAAVAPKGEIDWNAESDKAIADAQLKTSNNDFGILNDYYTTYIGRKLNQQKNKDKDLSYSESKEYKDLELLLDICKLKGIEPLFVHVPLHGKWSDYTGFTKERRDEYYQNVRDIVSRYDNVEMLDLTGGEYEQYFMSDVMHLGWKGWLEFDKALVRYYREG